MLISRPEVAAYFGKAYDFDWRTGIPAADAPAVLSALAAEGQAAAELVHPADFA